MEPIINNSSTATENASLEVSEEMHPISCVRCRKLHKKCDKKLSGCSKCDSLGITCVYNNPQKRGKASEHYSLKPAKKKKKTAKSSSSAAITSQQKEKVLTPINMIDIYFTCVCGIHPMIEKEKLKYFVNNCLSQFENKSKEDELKLEENIWIKSIGEMKCLYAFYLALMVVCSQIVADLETVDKYLRKAEIEIANISVDHSTEFYWAVACHYLYIGFVGEGDEYKSGYYLSKVNYFIESQDSFDHHFYKILVANSRLISARYKTETFTLQKLLEGTRNMFNFFTNRRVEDVLLPGTWDYMMTTKLSQQNFLLFKQVLDFIFKVLNHFKNDATRSVKDCHSEEFFRIQGLFACLLSEGFAFMYMKQIPEISFNIMEEIALKITLMTEHELFSVLFLATVGFAIEASEFHLQICKDIENGLKPRTGAVTGSTGRLITFDYFAILEKDLKGLNLLTARYRRVTKYYSNLINEMTQIIERNRTKDFSIPVISYSETPKTSVIQLPQQDDDILRKQLDESDFESFLADNPAAPWDEDFV